MSSMASRFRKDIVLTAGGMHALNLCINILTKPGDIVLIESPTHVSGFHRARASWIAGGRNSILADHGLDPDQFNISSTATTCAPAY